MQKNHITQKYYTCIFKEELRSIIRDLATRLDRELQQVNTTLQQTIDGQNETIATLQGTIDEKCEIIERQRMELQQVNETLQMFIETQETSNSEQDVIAANLTTLLARFPRKAFLP